VNDFDGCSFFSTDGMKPDKCCCVEAESSESLWHQCCATATRSQVTATAAAGSSWEDALAAVALRASGATLAALMKGAKAGCAGCWSRALQLALAQRDLVISGGSEMI